VYERLQDKAYEDGLDNRALQVRMLLDLGRRANPSARTLVEIGSGIGLLVHEARNAGLDATGIEPSRSLVAASARLLGVQLIQGTFPHPALVGKEFDLVFVVDVIEHVSDPVGLLSACHRAMSENGVLVVVTPDLGSLAARLLGRRWWHFRLAHVGYFDESTMRKAAERASLEIIERRRALWFFPIRYVASRLERYLPVGPINRLLLSTQAGERLYRKVIGVNPHDSWVFLLRKRPLT
jgi:SAM-dependent methyltransferase